MPGDVPVATVGANSGGARHAGILAVEMLALADDHLHAKLAAFKQRLRDKIVARDAAFQETLRGERQRT
jgi:5-(carboxyamino)imidazole ribonucleotide mutase